MISPNAEEWKKHNRTCWVEYEASTTHEEVVPAEPLYMERTLHVSVAFFEELSIFLGLRITCSKYQKHVFSVFEMYGIKNTAGILLMPKDRFDAMCADINIDIIASRLKIRRA